MFFTAKRTKWVLYHFNFCCSDGYFCLVLKFCRLNIVFAQSGSYMDYKVQKAKGSRLLRQLQEKYGLTVKKPAFHGYQIIFNKCG